MRLNFMGSGINQRGLYEENFLISPKNGQNAEFYCSEIKLIYSVCMSNYFAASVKKIMRKMWCVTLIPNMEVMCQNQQNLIWDVSYTFVRQGPIFCMDLIIHTTFGWILVDSDPPIHIPQFNTDDNLSLHPSTFQGAIHRKLLLTPYNPFNYMPKCFHVKIMLIFLHEFL